METIYQDIARRTGGNVYIGVVGPVRTGKSTLVKRIMEVLVLPGIEDPYRRERAKDELPQSGSGRTIMTSEPKFIPEEAVEVSPDGKTRLRLRLIDSVGYMVNGAVGAEEDGAPRMVTTPWYDHEIPMTRAAELGTKKVMAEHCTIGLVVTTDGTVTDIPREDYVAAEKQAIADMRASGKPFLVIVNSRNPGGEEAQRVKRDISGEWGLESVAVDCQSVDAGGIRDLLGRLLYTFPMGSLRVHLPRWMDVLENSHPVKTALYRKLLEAAEATETLGQAETKLGAVRELEPVREFFLRDVDLAEGTVSCEIRFPDSLFYEILSHRAGIPIENEGQLLSVLTELSAAKAEYDKISDALAAVKATGYGIVMPTAEEMELESPELVRKGGACGVKLKAKASAIHMIRVDLDTQISPMVGDEKQSKEMLSFLSAETPENLWQSNIFGRSVYDMIREGMTAKVIGMPQEVRGKFRGTLSRIVNEGATGLICLIL